MHKVGTVFLLVGSLMVAKHTQAMAPEIMPLQDSQVLLSEVFGCGLCVAFCAGACFYQKCLRSYKKREALPRRLEKPAGSDEQHRVLYIKGQRWVV